MYINSAERDGDGDGDGIGQAYEAIQAGVALFQVGQQLVTSGNLSLTTAPASYIHDSTPGNALWSRVSMELDLSAHHPRLGWSDQHFWFELSYDYNGYDIRDARVVLQQDRSSNMISSSFSVSFAPQPYTSNTESVAKIMFSISGTWDPVGRGVASFSGGLLISADGSANINLNSERNWVRVRLFRILSRRSLGGFGVTPYWDTFFAPGSDRIEEGAERQVVDWYRGLLPDVRTRIERGTLPIVLHGYASTTRDGPFNRDLSRRRAERVQRILADTAGSNARFELRAHGWYNASTPRGVESQQERRVRMEVSYAVGQ